MSDITAVAKGEPLIKFQRADLIEDFRRGHLYAKTLDYYRHFEQDDDDTIKDEYDGLVFTPEGKLCFPETGEVSDISGELLQTTASNDCVFCMFGIKPHTSEFGFTEHQNEKMQKFGDTTLIILDRFEFIQRVAKAAKRRSIEGLFGQVQYYKPRSPSAEMWITMMKNMHNAAFWKRDKYSYQQEWRFVFDTHMDQPDHLDLDIGDISDISIVCPAERTLKMFMTGKGEGN